MNPSDFSSKFPWGSVLRKVEKGIVALNIMIILKRTGNKFRKLSFNEYEKERLKDGNYSTQEKEYFDEVIKYCKNADTAKLFSTNWQF